MSGPTMSQFSDPKMIAATGEKIYEERYKDDLEKDSHGKFAVINIRTDDIRLGDTAEEAFEKAREVDPKGVFHLVRVGFPSAFQVSYAKLNSESDWLFG